MSRSIAVVDIGKPSPRFREWETVEVRFHDFAGLDATRGQSVADSSRFTCLGHEWFIRIYPGGAEDADAGMVTAYLYNLSNKSIKVDRCFSIKTSDGSLQGQKTFSGKNFAQYGVDGNSWGWRNFVQRATTIKTYLVEGTLVIMVQLKMTKPSKKAPTPFVPENPSAKIIQNLYMDEKSADVVFDVGERSGKSGVREKVRTSTTLFHAHHFVLQQCSATLADLCRSGDDQSNYVPIPDVLPDIFRHLLRYIYGRKIPEDELKENAKQILEAADKYGVPYLKLEAEVALVGSITITMDNMMDHLLYGDAKNCALLKETVVDFMVENKCEVVEKISFDDAPGSLVKDVFAAIARTETKSANDESNLCTMRISDLRRKVHVKGLDVDGSRETLIAILKENS